ncbi:MAG: hypothetical protein CL480_11050 [Acidobacteria bacterium]|nr:hypothetical protein [Acidobacteriota bacterium]
MVDLAEMARVLADCPEARDLLAELENNFYCTFRPRPDDPENYDQQQSFVEDQVPGVAGLLGGNACLGGEQELFDPVSGQSRRIDRITSSFWVSSLGDRYLERSRSARPFVKGVAPLFRIRLSTGESFVSTLHHRVLCLDEEWRQIRELRAGDCLFAIAAFPPEDKGKAFKSRERASIATHIDSIEYVRTDDFYDVHVPGNNNYLCAGVFHHNSGTSEAAAYKLAQFVLNRQEAPRPDTPFWVVGPRIDQTIKTFWKEKLYGHGHIPQTEVDWRRIRWHSEKQALPISVPLLPWPRGRGENQRSNWCIEFRSFAEGAAVMTAESIGGFCCTEPFPRELLTEIMRATREYNYPGSKFFELTPVDPTLTYWIEEMVVEDKVPPTWKFYRCNTESNVADPNSVVGRAWSDEFFASVSQEMTETRKTGAFASYEGLIYQTFNRAIHVVDDMPIPRAEVIHKRGIDWGASEDHPLAVVFGYKDSLGIWNIYGEYHSTDQGKLWKDHCEAICAMYPWIVGHPCFRQSYGDPSRPDLFREFNSNGIPVTTANNRVYEGIESVRKCLKVHPLIGPQIRVASWCKQTIKEFFTYRWEKSSGRGLNPKAAKPQPLKKYDDCMDALRYLIHTDARSTTGGAASYRTEQKQRPQVRHKRIHGR